MNDKNNNINEDTNIENFLEYSVEDIIWARVANEKINYSEIIDKNALLSYFKEKNEKYCAENCLCEVCRNPLTEFTEYEDICGSMQISEIYYSCPNGC